jgi:flagellar hook protein FlgE
MNLRWGKISNAPHQYALFYESNSGTESWRRIPGTFEFDGSGQLVSPVPATSTIPAVEINNITFQAMNFDLGDSLAMLNDSNVQPSFIDQDGYGVGRYDSVGISEDGVVSIAYTNGQVVPVAELNIVGFYAPNALRRVDGGAFEATRESGDPSVAFARGTILSGGVESSNTDISEEFAKMIVTQQAYTANTRVISTSQEMIREVLNVVR